MADKLKRCPFCGGEVDIFDYWNEGKKKYRWVAMCTNCKGGLGELDTKEEAVEKWNNRTSPWHTGTPTEEGWYVLRYPESKEQPYELAQWNGEHFVAVKPFHAIIVRIEASSVPYWQKIKED